ncbi:MAG: hypothetical protein SOX46_04230 [Clostridiaceae bacterium]|nr:hypothetical protein [Clostridiaceae bacterium]
MNDRNVQKKEIRTAISKAEKVLIGIGGEWRLREDGKKVRSRRLKDEAQRALREGYESLYRLIKDKDYYIVTTLTDGAIYDTELASSRIVAPCGNIHWRQCSKACTKDIWEEGEVPSDVCPYCGAPMTGNTLEAEDYIEEGYLPRWEAYKQWQAGTLNRRLVILELGEGFKLPTVIRWPFEKIAFFNQKSAFFRIHKSLSQIPKEVEERAWGIGADSLEWIRGMV